MQSLTETSTQLIKSLRDLNQELRQKLSSMPSCTEQEILSLAQWLEEVEVGARLRKSFFDNLPSFKALKDRVGRAAKKGYIKGIDGRKLIVRSEHAALNTLLQSAGAIVMKKALIIFEEK